MEAPRSIAPRCFLWLLPRGPGLKASTPRGSFRRVPLVPGSYLCSPLDHAADFAAAIASLAAFALACALLTISASVRSSTYRRAMVAALAIAACAFASLSRASSSAAACFCCQVTRRASRSAGPRYWRGKVFNHLSIIRRITPSVTRWPRKSRSRECGIESKYFSMSISITHRRSKRSCGEHRQRTESDPGCVKTHTSAKCRKHNSPARHRTSRVQYDFPRPGRPA